LLRDAFDGLMAEHELDFGNTADDRRSFRGDINSYDDMARVPAAIHEANAVFGAVYRTEQRRISELVQAATKEYKSLVKND
jgi:hypothetical protein